eukprot:CAMPEP_0119119888 /NCGR_PEP_ID=MMETSP1310-20130426/1185_1 /TAXON_ID=464262 /ORGANISM="Genus nov. species nov., Strain RCC2339" /LENGTH=457 /DNA_ID=CAMNT_0007109347 /DNA_START=81 /DNA_END=1454 /DNA_ORIENTATION=-
MMQLRVGNTYEWLSEDEAVPARSNPEFLKVHKWSLYVIPDGVPGALVTDLARIREVEFILHESFSPKSFLKVQPPFRTTQTSYGFFTAVIWIRFYHAPPVRVEHELVFADGGASQPLVVQAGVLPTLDEIPVPNLCFGVELELLIGERRGFSAERVAEELEHVGISARSVGYSKAVVPYWKVVSDSSLSCPRGDENCLRFELVSPILWGRQGIDDLSVVIGILNEMGVTVNRSCALHCHVDAGEFSQMELNKICAQFVKYEEAFDLMMPRSRTGNSNRYARSNRAACFGKTDNSHVNHLCLTRRNPGGLQALLNPGQDRYYKLNLMRLYKESPTIEFRQHGGTCNFEKVRAWVMLLLKFCENSANQAAPDNFKNSHKPGYKFQRLFDWVVRSPLLQDYYTQRAWSLLPQNVHDLDDARLWRCSCDRTFARCGDYMNHVESTNHDDPWCCDGCRSSCA